MRSSEVQPRNTLLAIVPTLEPISMSVNKEQPSNVAHSRVFIPVPIFADCNAVHYQYLQPVITQYFASNKSEIWS